MAGKSIPYKHIRGWDMTGRYLLPILFFILFSVSYTPVRAESLVVHESGWIVNTDSLPTPNPVAPFPEGVEPYESPNDVSVNQAWNRVLAPVKGVGVTQSGAEGLINGTKDRFIDDSGEMLENAKAWGVIIGDLGLGPLARSVAKDWFLFTTTDVPQNLR